MFETKSWGLRGGRMGASWLSALMLAALSLSAARADDKGWVLTQKSNTLGDQYVYISPNGLKCYNPKAGFALVTHAPDWQVVLYNEKTRVYYETTVEKWKHELAARGLKGDLQNKTWARGSKSQICGLNATQYVMNGSRSATVRTKDGKTKRTTINGAAYWVSDDIMVPPHLADLLATAYGLPTTQNIPLRLSCNDSGGARTLLETYRSQATPIPVSYFTCPSGFTPVKSDAEVMMTDEQKQIINDMARQLSDEPGGGGGTAGGVPPAPGAPAATTPGAVPAAATTTGAAPPASVGGLKLDKDSISRIINALKKSNK